MLWFKRLLPIFLFTGLLQSCSESTPETTTPTPSEKPVVHAANYPLFYFAERIAGDFAEVKFLAPRDEDPAFWKPAAEEIGEMQVADLLLLNGAGYSKWLTTTSLPKSILVDTSAAFSGEFIVDESAASHKHGDGEAHSHGEIAFTTWLDFQQAVWQAEEIRDAMIARLPEEEATIAANFNALADDLDALHAEFKSIGEKLGDRPFVASHPVYQYFARRYGLNIVPVLWEPDTVPNAEQMAELKAILADHPAKTMIWEAPFSEEGSDKIYTLGINSLVIDPCGNRPDGIEEDWLSVMKQNVDNLRVFAND